MAASAFIPAFFSCAAAASSPSSSFSSNGPRRLLLLPTQLCRFRLSALISPPQQQHHPSTSFAARSMSGPSSSGQIEDLLKGKNSQNPVVVYSRTWCPYCGMVKGLFDKLGVKPFVVELDELADEVEIQAALQRLTGQSTVPNVFIGGKHIGGCDDTMALHRSGKLIPLLKEAGASIS